MEEDTQAGLGRISRSLAVTYEIAKITVSSYP